ncbi:tetratricopeptide repeat protein [Desulfococcaceae bacterium HSG9]|nr:tetratricopeptide repeat protein [Desulfococcaceae bacterium HSG9]
MKKLFLILFLNSLFFSSSVFADRFNDVPKKFKDKFSNAEKLRIDGEYKEALPIFTHLIVDAPKSVSILYSYGILLAEMKRYDESSKFLDKALEISAHGENDLQFLNTRGWVSIMLGEYEKALEYFDKAMSDSKYNDISDLLKMKLHNNAGVAYWQSDRYDEAAKQFRLAKSSGSQLADKNLRMVESVLETINSKDINIPGVFAPVVGSSKYDFHIERQKKRITIKLGIDQSILKVFISSNGRYLITQGNGGLSYPKARMIVLSAKKKGISDAFVSSTLNWTQFVEADKNETEKK